MAAAQLPFDEACIYCRQAFYGMQALLNHRTVDCRNVPRQRKFGAWVEELQKSTTSTSAPQPRPGGGGGGRGGKGGRGGGDNKQTPSQYSRILEENEKMNERDEKMLTLEDLPAQRDSQAHTERVQEIHRLIAGLREELQDYYNSDPGRDIHFYHESEYLAAAGMKTPRTVCADVAGYPTHIALDTRASANLIAEDLVTSLSKRGARLEKFQHPRKIILADGKSTMKAHMAIEITLTVKRTNNKDINFSAYCYVVPNLFVPIILSGDTCKEHGLLQYEEHLCWYVDTPTEEEPEIIDVQEWLNSGLFDKQTMPRVAESLTRRDDFLKMLTQYGKIVDDPTFPPAARMAPVEISIHPHKSMRQTRNRHFPIKKMQALREQIAVLLKNGFIKRLDTGVPAAAQVVMVAKKATPGRDPEYRMAIDFSPTLNQVAQKVQGYIPDVDDLVRDVAEYEYYAQFDLKAAYWQIPLAESSIPHTAFMADGVIYGCTRLPTGFSEAPAIFNNWTDQCFAKINGKQNERQSVTRKYFDNIVCAANTEAGLLAAVQEVLEVCKENNLTISASKTEIGFPSTIFLGHKVDRNGMSIDPERIASLLRIARPKTRKQLRGILGTFNFVRKFIPGYSDITAILTPLTSERVPFEWTAEQDRALMALKSAVEQATTLANIDYKKDIFINTDASKRAVGAVLYQYDEDGTPVAIAFTSRKLASQQTRWPNWERELYAVFVAFEVWHHLISGFHVHLATDCKGIFNLTPAKVSDKVARWLSFIWQQSHTMTHVKGDDNVAADCLSRQVGEKEDSQALMGFSLPPRPPPRSPMETRQVASSAGATTISVAEKGSATAHPSHSTVPQQSSLPEEMEVCAMVTTRSKTAPERVQPMAPSGPLTKKQKEDAPSQKEKKKRKTPEPAQPPAAATTQTQSSSLVQTIDSTGPPLEVTEGKMPDMKWAHGGTHGHWGVEKTLIILQDAKRTWKGMKKDITSFIKSCGICQKYKERKVKPVGEVRNVEALMPFECWSIDFAFISELNEYDAHGHSHFLCVIDDATRFVWAVPTTATDSAEAIRALEQIIPLYRQPNKIRYDSGSHFTSKAFGQYLSSRRIDPHKTTAGRHEANGMCERVIQTLKTQTGAVKAENETMEWCEALAIATQRYNMAPHSALKTTPRQAMFPDPTQLLELLAGERGLSAGAGAAGGGLSQAILTNVMDSIQLKAQTLKKRKADAKDTQPTIFQVDDLVLKWKDQPFGRKTLRPRLLGPFKVTARNEQNDSYTIVDVRGTAPEHPVHVSHLRPFDSSRTECPATLAALDDQKFVIDKVLDHITETVAGGRRTTDLLVKWLGFDTPSWTHVGSITPTNCTALREYVQRKKLHWSGGCVESRR